MSLRKKSIAVIMGSRSEAIKMAPVVHALRKHAGEIETVVISTSQHEMVDQVLSLFHISPDVAMNIVEQGQSLTDLTAQVLLASREIFEQWKPDLLLVQGNTPTVFAVALSAFYLRIPVGHVEAGLRSQEVANSYPEDLNRRLTSIVSDLYFPPSTLARDNLVQEGVSLEKIVVTGNTAIDALDVLLQQPYFLSGSPLESIPLEGKRVLLLTSQQPVSFGENLANICWAIKDLVNRFSDLLVVCPIHGNPRLRSKAFEILVETPGVLLVDPLDYMDFAYLMQRSFLILTDRGGIQEEAPSLHKPVLVVGCPAEKHGDFPAGLVKRIGNARETIFFEVSRLLADDMAYKEMGKGVNPYGDGQASERIADAVVNWARGEPELLTHDKQFMSTPFFRKFGSSSASISYINPLEKIRA